MYCGDARLMKSAKAYHSAFVSFCHGEWVCIAPTSRDLSSIQDRVSNDWTMWYEAESRRRTGYCIWVRCRLQMYVKSLTNDSLVAGLHVEFPFSSTSSSIFRGRQRSNSLSGGSLGGRVGTRLAAAIRILHS